MREDCSCAGVCRHPKTSLCSAGASSVLVVMQQGLASGQGQTLLWCCLQVLAFGLHHRRNGNYRVDVSYFWGLGSRGFKSLKAMTQAMTFKYLLNCVELFTKNVFVFLLNGVLVFTKNAFVFLLNPVWVFTKSCLGL